MSYLITPGAPQIRSKSPHPVRKYVERVASQDIEEYPEWDLKKPLPKLPVPELKDTCDKYLLCIESVVSVEQYQKTKALVEEFCKAGGEGEKLQKMLLEYAETKDNWAYDWWLEDMYMKNHLALPINSNPGMVFPRQEFEDMDAWLRYTARLISGILDYKVIIDSKSLPVDRARHREKGQPLCMEQYYRLFSNYRQPGVEKDRLVDSSQNKDPEHIIVICRNQLFVLDVNIGPCRLSDDNFYTQLKRIVRLTDDHKAETEPVGILTSMDRDKWAEARLNLIKDPINKESLELIEKCIFVLCLDKCIPLSFNHQRSIDETDSNKRDDVSLALQMLHGQGSQLNSSNRWFDKTMQFIISEDGACGLNYEHSPSEGIAVVQLIEHLLKYMEEVRLRRLPRYNSIRELPYPRKLQWKVNSEITNDISVAMNDLDALIKSLDLYVLRFEKFGKEFPKSVNMSPDAFIQLALQLAYYRSNKTLVSTYESASIRRFRKGRVDNIRACTLEALEWCKTMTGEVSATDEEKMSLFRKAMKRQTEILVQAILGYGIDNHLLGLKRTAEDNGKGTPAVFEDETYKMSNQFTLSTSQVPTTMDAFMMYGPVVPNGYGACYNPHPNSFLVVVTSFVHCSETRSDDFALTLESCFMEMHDLCTRVQDSATKSSNAGINGVVGMNNNLQK